MHFCVTLLCYSERQRGYPLNVQHAFGGFLGWGCTVKCC